jgi:hypothetical protein
MRRLALAPIVHPPFPWEVLPKLASPLVLSSAASSATHP